MRLLDAYGNALTTKSDVAATFKPVLKETPWTYQVDPTGSSFDPVEGIYTAGISDDYLLPATSSSTP
jgi:hypothetical protein